MDRSKYAVIRLPESRVVEFFSIIAPHGFTDVSFHSENPLLAGNADGFTSGTADMARDRILHENSDTPSPQLNVDTKNVLDKEEVSPPVATASASTSAPITLSDLFPSMLKSDSPIDLDGAFEVDGSYDMDASGADDDSRTPIRGYHQRMKGWQRTFLTEMLKDGYPTEEKLKEAMDKCQLTRRQVLRFVAKRVNNPHRAARTDWRAAKAMENISDSHFIENSPLELSRALIKLEKDE